MNQSREITTLQAGFIPLIDSAILIAAQEKGFAAREGLHLALRRETSWANIRDRIAVGHFDVAHMLAPMPIAANLGLDPLPARMIAPMALGLNGNAIVASNAVCEKMLGHSHFQPGDAAAAARILAQVIDDMRTYGSGERLTFAIVHPNSAHRYELAYMFAHAGLKPGEDYDLVVLPPSLMVDALASNQISGFCAGEPWGSLAVERSCGQIIATKASIWRSSPEKVLGMRLDWAQKNATSVASLIRALHQASIWCDAMENRDELCSILARTEFLNQPEALIRRASLGQTSEPQGENAFVFARNAATFPWRSHALWLYAQMVRWGQAPFTPQAVEAVNDTFRPNIYRAALAPLEADIPVQDSRIEGAEPRTRFFDGRTFDPALLQDYLAGLAAG